jgi:hypothetical protein
MTAAWIVSWVVACVCLPPLVYSHSPGGGRHPDVLGLLSRYLDQGMARRIVPGLADEVRQEEHIRRDAATRYWP